MKGEGGTWKVKMLTVSFANVAFRSQVTPFLVVRVDARNFEKLNATWQRQINVRSKTSNFITLDTSEDVNTSLL